jgi:murein L,D-transpeptidase YafK
MTKNNAGQLARLRRCARAAMAAAFMVFLAGFCPAWATPVPLASGLKADRIVVLKSARRLELLRGGVILATYPIALGSEPIGPKRARGDGKTPEGTYIVDRRHDNSPYHLALHISYPNPTDRARSAGSHRDPGGDIFIHGLPAWFGMKNPDRFYKDWTQGCISVGNSAIEEIWARVDNGTPIEIRP